MKNYKIRWTVDIYQYAVNQEDRAKVVSNALSNFFLLLEKGPSQKQEKYHLFVQSENRYTGPVTTAGNNSLVDPVLRLAQDAVLRLRPRQARKKDFDK